MEMSKNVESKQALRAVLMVACASIISIAGVAADVQYEVVDLGTLGGPSYAMGMNDMGQVVGYCGGGVSAQGFVAEIRERTIDGTVYYRVLIPDIDSDEVDEVILQLKEKGFEGFRIYE